MIDKNDVHLMEAQQIIEGEKVIKHIKEILDDFANRQGLLITQLNIEWESPKKSGRINAKVAQLEKQAGGLPLKKSAFVGHAPKIIVTESKKNGGK